MILKLTDEQINIINSDSKLMSIQALAGTGKTTTLVEIAKKHADKRVLYLAFNKAIEEEAKKKFPDNTLCKTTHALVYPWFCKKYTSSKIGAIKNNQIRSTFNVDSHDASKALSVIHEWSINSLESVSDTVDLMIASKRLNIADRDKYSKLVIKILSKCFDKNSDFKIPFDMMLKMYLLSGDIIKYDVVLFDEAQDQNDCTIELVLNKIVADVICFVGDKHQAIYGFRGAKDALSKIEAKGAEVFVLSKSFRFGEYIASIANYLLTNQIKSDKNVIGLGRHKNPVTQRAYIGRTNISLLYKALQLINNKYAKIKLIGGLRSYNPDLIRAMCELKHYGRSSTFHPLVSKFNNYWGLRSFAENQDEEEIQDICKLLDKIDEKTITTLLDKLLKFEKLPDDEITDVLVTAHKSKGLEFDDVTLLDGFYNGDNTKNDKPMKDDDIEQELNILYVAVTRAKQYLNIAECSIFNDIIWDQC